MDFWVSGTYRHYRTYVLGVVDVEVKGQTDKRCTKDMKKKKKRKAVRFLHQYLRTIYKGHTEHTAPHTLMTVFQ